MNKTASASTTRDEPGARGGIGDGVGAGGFDDDIAWIAPTAGCDDGIAGIAGGDAIAGGAGIAGELATTAGSHAGATADCSVFARGSFCVGVSIFGRIGPGGALG